MFEHLFFRYNTFFEGRIEIKLINNKSCLEVESLINFEKNKKKLDSEKSKKIIDDIEKIGIDTWLPHYQPEGFFILDGYSWDLEYNGYLISGVNAYPWCFYQLIRVLIEAEPRLENRLGEYTKEVKCFYI